MLQVQVRSGDKSAVLRYDGINSIRLLFRQKGKLGVIPGKMNADEYGQTLELRTQLLENKAVGYLRTEAG